MKTCFQYDDPMLDYEILWALTNLTALLRPDEIENMFTKDYDVLSFIINKLKFDKLLIILDMRIQSTQNIYKKLCQTPLQAD